MYELFYQFTAEPFRLSPDHRFCFEHKSYGKARAYMAYAFKRAEGFVMITGRPGTGKTTLIGELVESLSRDKVITANLVCTQLQADDLLKTVAYSFGISPDQVGKAELLQRLNILLHRWHREGRRALLVVDEAQDLSSSAMEELRLLTNIQFGGQPLLQIFLLGQPELRDLILSPEMEQVHQRIVAASHIEGLEADETEAYVIHRLSRVGWQGDPAIDRAIFPFIHRFSEGIPRRINLICSRLFLLGSVEERHTIELADVRVVIGELQAENLAAGTGISQEDFRGGIEPQWVPVPVSAAQVAPAAPLQAVSAPSVRAIEQPSVDPSAEAKKKDIPNLEPLVKLVPKSDAEIPVAVATHLEFVQQEESVADGLLCAAEIEQVTGGLPDDVEEEPLADGLSDSAMIASDARLAVSNVRESGSIANTAAVEASPFPRRRLVMMAFLMILAIALVLVLKACGTTKNDGALGETASRMPSVVVSQPLAATADRVTESGEPLHLPDETIVDRRQQLMPIVVAASLRSSTPFAVASEVLPVEPPSDSERSDLNESSSAVLSPVEDRAVKSTENAAKQNQQQTILVPFSFDSDDLIPDAHVALDKAAVMLQKNTASVASITGFTDSRGDSHYNLVLSRKRADAVERYLVDAGIARERLHVEGRGVLDNRLDGHIPGVEYSLETSRIVQITLRNEG